MKVLFVDLTTALDSFMDLSKKGRGGMVSSLFLLPNVLSKLNNECFVFSDSKQGGTTDAGVEWLTEQDWWWIANQKWDFLVLNRQTYKEGFPEIQARHRILWVHDMVHGGWIPNPSKAKMLSAVVFMSKYSEETWRAYYRDIGRSFQIPNGVDKELFKPGIKDLDQLIYFSAPNRGLEYLPVILDTVRDATKKDIKLKAFSNMSKMHPKEGGNFDDLYSRVREAGIELLDPVPQKELADHVGRAGLMVKPSNFAETCSNVILQSLASGTPVITSRVGADKEWVTHKWNGMLSRHSLNDGPLFIMEICRDIVEVLNNKTTHEMLIDNAPKTQNLFTWEEIGQKWNKMLNRVY